ncbi:tetratricopeptide repeat protein [Glycomyces buryatensis]|uniref:Tetratricopeptide repeat protein n=1 Tax=Glycomyces buryatensis TaxID=2570927 RepID=A0A4S8QGZ9_9ACTN|nr:tetratricopeptide repeat protein [Glycomyces buryatensis]THV42245.1 tetratricopeptide repeat protein [Glycomyces buryatensis]
MNGDDQDNWPEQVDGGTDGYVDHSRKQSVRRLERALLAAEQHSGSCTAGKLAELFVIARDFGMELDQALRSRLVNALKYLYVVGDPAGDAEPLAGRPSDDVITLIEELDDPDNDPDPIRSRIMTAQVYSRVDGRVTERGEVLKEAYTLCPTSPERVEVGIILAQFQVDTGCNRRAKRILTECGRLVGADDSGARLLPELAVCRGGLLFAQGRLRGAQRCFSEALSAMDRLSRSRHERPGVKAYHYLGKIHALYGRYERAVENLVRAEELLEQRAVDDRRQSGHNHSRLGEVLNKAGSPDARWHSSKARDLFIQAGDESSGRGLQEGASGGPAEPIKHRIQRYELRQQVARNNQHWRSAVIASFRLMLIHGRHGTLWTVVGHAWRALEAGTRLVLRSGPLASTAGVVELAMASVVRTARKRRMARLKTPLRCHCLQCRSKISAETRRTSPFNP